MKIKFYLAILLIISLFTLTGCTPLNGIDQFYFIISMGIDETDDGILNLSIQVSSNSGSSEDGKSSSSQSSDSKIYSVEASTIDEGLTILDNYLNKKINLSHCSAVIFSEDVAKKGIKKYFNTLNNNTELRETCNLIISSSTAYDLMSKVSNSGEIFSSRLFDYLTNSEKYTGFTNKSTIGTFSKALHTTHCEPTAIYALVSDNVVQTAGIAVFKNEYMVGHIDSVETIAHLILKKDLNECMLTIDSPFEEDEKLDLEVSLYKETDIDINLINGTPFVSIDIYPEGFISSSGKNFDFINNNNIGLVESATNKYVGNLVKNYLYNITKNYNSDIIGLGCLYKTKFLTEDEFNKIEWKKIFQDSFFEVNVHSKINSSNLFNKE